MDNLFHIIQKAKMNYPSFSARLEEAKALGRWKQAVGELIAKHSRAIRVLDSILWIEVENPIWRAELHYRKKQILDILNDNPDFTQKKEYITDVQFLDPFAYGVARYKKKTSETPPPRFSR